MHAFLILGNDSQEIDKAIKSKLPKNTTPLEFSVDKIEKTRELNKFLALSQPPNTTILIRDVDLATTESLNAFLKNLEEPNTNVTFFLTAKSQHKVLPTIVSRCQLIKTKILNTQISDDLPLKFIDFEIGEKLKTIDKIKKREEALDFVQDILSALHQSLYKKSVVYQKNAYLMKIAQQTLDALNQNGNVTMQLTNMVIKMQKITSPISPNRL